MDFHSYVNAQKKHIDKMIASSGGDLFEIGNIDKGALYQHYLESHIQGHNEIYRVRVQADCSNCRNFIRNFSNMVIINNDLTITTVWDFVTGDENYDHINKCMGEFVRKFTLTDFFIKKESKFGLEKNVEVDNATMLTKTWYHMNYQLPANLVHNNRIRSVESVAGELRTNFETTKRALNELTIDSANTALELIEQKTLYRGNEYKHMLISFKSIKENYSKITDPNKRDLYIWKHLRGSGANATNIRNSAIGTFLIDLSAGVDLEIALKKYESVTAPSTYKRPQAVFTQKMLEEAKVKFEELGLMNSLKRRFANLEDISISNVIFANRDAAKRMVGGDSIFDEMSQNKPVSVKSLGRIEEVGIEEFISKHVPFAKNIEVLVENRLTGNLVSLITASDKDAKPLTKWDNGFTWAYAGNITDSMKERVKAAGGNINGILRCSIQWNDEDDNKNDYDLHCIEPGNHIYFGNKKSNSSGFLDVDIVNPRGVAVENIAYTDKNRMKEGTYRFYVNNFNHRGGRSGFRAQIEFDGVIYNFDCSRDITSGSNVDIAEVVLKNGVFSINEKLKSSAGETKSRKEWGVSTNMFVPVTAILHSPNYWDGSAGLGNKHFFFMLKDCVNNENPNGFFNEFIKEEYMPHKRVMEALGSKMKVESVEDQLSGVGFTETKRDFVIVKTEGAVSRTLKVNF